MSATKAQALAKLRFKLRFSEIARFETVSVRRWQNDLVGVLKGLRSRFRGNVRLIVRSSALGEESYGMFAGALASQADIAADDEESLRHAINRVVTSFSKHGRRPLGSDQILVQEYIGQVKIVGVVLTWNDRLNQPYYIINYDPTAHTTDLVTSGRGGRLLKIFNKCAANQVFRPWRTVLRAVREIESLSRSSTLDIEFAVGARGQVHIFQVRRLTRKVRRRNKIVEKVSRALETARTEVDILSERSRILGGNETLFSDMADWNPAEMLGPRPRLLARSLYQRLITDQQWNHSRASIGYFDVGGIPLLVTIADKPYIDTRVSLHSLTPMAVQPAIRKELVRFSIAHLRRNPGLHDKLEFQLAFSCYDFSVPARLRNLTGEGFPRKMCTVVERQLRTFTNALLDSGLKTIASDLRGVHRLRNLQRQNDEQSDPRLLLERCQTKGVYYFARLARFAFVALALLKSLAQEGIIAQSVFDAVFRSLKTFPHSLRLALMRQRLRRRPLSSFLEEHGHLRPMAYDITAERYDRLPETFWSDAEVGNSFYEKRPKSFGDMTGRVQRALERHGLRLDASNLLVFIRRALEARELAKFVFTRDLSDALECVAMRFAEHDVDRDAVSHLSIDDILSVTDKPAHRASGALSKCIALSQTNASRYANLSHVALPPTIASSRDLLFTDVGQAVPNYVTQKRVTARLLSFSSHFEEYSQVCGKILLLESADPGFDWVFLHRPLGIITQHGGAGSHMAVRCAACGLPAAIGCGEEIFDKLKQVDSVILDCAAEAIIPLI